MFSTWRTAQALRKSSRRPRASRSNRARSVRPVLEALEDRRVPSGLVIGADSGGGPNVIVFDHDREHVRFNFFAFDPNFTGGVRVATGDVNGDGIDDIIAAAGPGGGPNINVFDGRTGDLIRSFMAFDSHFTGGVVVAAGDVNGDGFADIIVGADRGGGPNVVVFSGKDNSILADFMAFDSHFTGGVRVAAGDVNGDGRADVIVGAGVGGGPNVAVFSGTDGRLLLNFFAFNSAFTGGIFVAAGDLTGDGADDIIVGAGASGGPNVAVFRGDNALQIMNFFASTPASPAASASPRPTTTATASTTSWPSPAQEADLSCELSIATAATSTTSSH